MQGPGSFWKALEAPRTLAAWGLEFEGRGRLVDSLQGFGGEGILSSSHSKEGCPLFISGL